MVEQAYKALGRAGTVVVVGVADMKDKTSISTFALPADEARAMGEIALTRGQIAQERRANREPGVPLGRITGATALVEAELNDGRG